MAKTVSVKKGETLSAIAKANGVSLQALIAANPQIKNPNTITVGQKVVIPDATETAAETNKKLAVEPTKNTFDPATFRIREANADLKVQDGVKIPALDTPKADTLYKNLPQDTLDDNALAARFSIAASILNQDESLKKVLNQILAKKVTDPNLQMAMLKETDWFKNNTDDWRKYQFYKDSNPATYQADLQKNAEAFIRKYHAMGVKIDAPTAIKLAEQAMMKSANVNGAIVNYDENYFNQIMANSLDFSKKRTLPNGKIVYDLSGKTETIANTLYKTAWDYGYQASVSNKGFSSWLENNVKGLIAGTINPEDVDNELQSRAKSMFPGLASQISAGQTLRQAADPWINALANEWEEDPYSMDLNDDFLYRVLNYQDEKGNVSPMSLYQAKVMARRSPKWQYTSKAKEEYTNIGQKILQDFGFLG
jgi:LysM repeat protein